MVTINDVARRAGVSTSVVSRVLNNDAQVRTRPETRERVRLAAEELGYRPNYAGRALRSAKTHTIALVVPDLFNSAFAPLFMGVQEEAKQHDYVVLLARAEDAHVNSAMVKHLVNERRIDGLLLQKEDESDSYEWLLVNSADTPILMLNSGDSPGIPSVHLDDATAGRLATERLLRAGHRRIAMINGVVSSGTAQERHRGYATAMAEAGHRALKRWTTWRGYDPASAADSLEWLWTQREPPTAVVVANVNAAMGILLRARRLGISVPEDLSVVAIHDVDAADNTWPPLTTVRMPMNELGRLGARQLLASIRGESVPTIASTLTPPVLIERESVRDI